MKIAFIKLINDVHNKNKRHGLNSTKCREKCQSIGMRSIASGDIITHATFSPILIKAAARGAVADV